MEKADYVIIGSGINALVCAAMLALKGRKVLVLERNAEIGGCIRTEEMIAPGYAHDVMATTFVLFITGPAFGALGKELTARGLEFCHSPEPTGVLLPDGRSLKLTMKRDDNVAAFAALNVEDGAQYRRDVESIEREAGFLFALLGGSLWSWGTAKLLLKQAWARGLRGLASYFGDAMTPTRGWLETSYRSELFRALWAPWVLHLGLGPESAYSGKMTKVIAFATEAAGTPIVKGGAKNLLAAFRKLIEDKGGTIRTNSDAVSIARDATGAASSVTLANGEKIEAERGVICSVTPNQLYTRLLEPPNVPAEIAASVKAYRYGKGNMQIHYALKAPPKWKTPGLEKVALLHLTPGLDGVSKAANEAERGMLPETPTICVGQPSSLDPSRCPEGAAILWLQLPEAPRHVKGDAAGRIKTPADGKWTETLREAYADRIEAILMAHIDGFAENIIGRRCYSPADLEAMNINLVGGDPYGGFCGLDQFFIWRPFKSSVNHRTHVPRLYQIGASTHPGPGLGGGSGFLLANVLE
jgi:phytoene dehydrogenase-like protein